MMRVEAERRIQGMQLESNTCRARLAALQDECRKMEEMVANMLQYKAKVDQLKQENASMKSSYEANLSKYCSHISSLERDNMVLRNQVKKMESQIHGKGDERDKSKLLLERLKMVEAENSSLVLENEQQRQQYEKCLDEIANQVVQALLAQKMLREECFKLQSRVQDLELQNKHLNAMFQQSMKMSADSMTQYGAMPLNASISPTTNGALALGGGEMNLDYMAIAGSLHSMCSEVMGDDSPGKPQLSSPPPWLKDKLMMMMMMPSSSAKSGGSGGSVDNTNQNPLSSSPDSLASSSQQSRTTMESAEQVTQTKIETEFPATNASPKMKHIPVGDRRSRSLERGSSGPFSWMKRMGKGGLRSRRGSETHERNDCDDDDNTPRQRLKQSTSADALTHYGVGNKKSKSKSTSTSTTSSKNKLSQSMDNSEWKDSLTPERLNARGAKLLLRTTSADIATEKNSSGVCDINHQSFEAFNKSFEKLLAKHSKEDNASLESSKVKTASSNVKQENANKTTATKQTSTSTPPIATTVKKGSDASSKNGANTKDKKSQEPVSKDNSSSKVNQSTSTDRSSKNTFQHQQQHPFQQQQQQQQQQHQQQQQQQQIHSTKSSKPLTSSSQALRNPFAEPSASSVKSPRSGKSPSPLPGQYYYYDYSDEDSDSRPVSRDFSTASTMSLNEILDSSQEAEVALDDDFFSDWSSVCISPQKRIDKLTGQTISNNAMVSKGKGASSSSSSSSSKLSSSSSPDSPRHLHLYKAFMNINKQQQLGAKSDLLQHFKQSFPNPTKSGKPEPIYDEPYIPELDTAADQENDTETPISAPIVSKTVSQKAVTRSLTDPSNLASPFAATISIPNNNSNFTTTEVKAEIHTENFQRSSSNSNFQPSPSLSPNPSQISQDLGYASKGSYHSQSSPSPSPSMSHRGTPPWLHSTKDPHSFSRNELLSLVINRDGMAGSPRFIPNAASPSSDSPKPISRPGQLILAPQDKNFNFQGGFSSVSSTSSSEDKSPIKMFESKSSMNKMESSVIEVKKDCTFSSAASTSFQHQQQINVMSEGAGGTTSLPTSPNSLKSPTSKIPPPVARKPIRAVKPEARSRTLSSSSSSKGDNSIQTSVSIDHKSNSDNTGKSFPSTGNSNMTVGFVLQDSQTNPILNPLKTDGTVIDSIVRNIMAKESVKTPQDSPSKHPHHHHSEFGSPSHQTKICPSSDSSFENLRVERSGSKDDGYSTMSSDIHPEILERFCDNTLTLKRSETSTEAHFVLNINNKTGSLKINGRSNDTNYQRAVLERRNSDSVLQSNSARDRSFDNLVSDQDSAMETSVHSTTAEMVTSSCSSQISMSSTDLASPTTLTNKTSKLAIADFLPTSSTSAPSQGQCKTSSPKKSLESRSSTDLSAIPVKSNNNSKKNCSGDNKVSKIARLFENRGDVSPSKQSVDSKSSSDQQQSPNTASPTTPTKSSSPSPSSPRHFFPNSSSNSYRQQPESPRRLVNEFQRANQNNLNTTNKHSSSQNSNTVIKKKSNANVSSASNSSPQSPTSAKVASCAKQTSVGNSPENKPEKPTKLPQQMPQQQNKLQNVTGTQKNSTPTSKHLPVASSKKSPTQSKTNEPKQNSTKIPNLTNKKNSNKATSSTTSGTTSKSADKQKLSENRKSFSSSLDKVKNVILPNSIKKSKGNNKEKQSDALKTTSNTAQKKTISDSKTNTRTISPSKNSDVTTEFTLVLNAKSQDSSGVILELVKEDTSRNLNDGNTSSFSSAKNENSCATSITKAEYSVVLDNSGKVDTISEHKDPSVSVSSQHNIPKNNSVSTKSSVNNLKDKSTVHKCDGCKTSCSVSSQKNRSDDYNMCNLPKSTCVTVSVPQPSCSKAMNNVMNSTSKMSTSSSSSSTSSSSSSSSATQNNDFQSSSNHTENRKSLIMLTNQAFQDATSSSDDSDGGDSKPLSKTLPPQYKPFPLLTNDRVQLQKDEWDIQNQASSSSLPTSSSSLYNGHVNHEYTSPTNDKKAISSSKAFDPEPKAISQHHQNSNALSKPSSSLSYNMSNDTSSHDKHFPPHCQPSHCHNSNNDVDDNTIDITKGYSSKSSTADNSTATELCSQWQYYQPTNDDLSNIPYLRRSLSEHSIRNGSSSSISKLSTSSTSSSEEEELYGGNNAPSGMPLQRSVSASQLDVLHKKYWGGNQQQQQQQQHGNFSNNEIISSSSPSLSTSTSSNHYSHHHQQSRPNNNTNSSSTHHFQRFHGYHNVYSGHHRQQLQRHRLDNYPFLTQSLRLDLSDVTELDEDGSELASTKDSLDTSTGGVSSDESPRPLTSDKNQFNSQFYSLCQVGSNKSLLSSSFESKEKLSVSMTSSSCNENSSSNINNNKTNNEEDEIALQEFDQISKQIASLSKTVDELNNSLSSLNSGEYEPTNNRALTVSHTQASSSTWGASGDGSAKTDADGYHWVDDEFYLASSSNEKLVIVKSSAKENDYVDYTAFCQSQSIISSEIYHRKLSLNDCFNEDNTSQTSEESLDEGEYEVMNSQNLVSSPRSQKDGRDVLNSPSHFENVVYRRQRSAVESSRSENGFSQKRLVRWTSEGNLSQIQQQTLRGDTLDRDSKAKRLSMPLHSNDLEKAFEGWDVKAPVDDIKTLAAFDGHMATTTTSSSDDDGDSLASDIGLDHMMCQRLIGPNSVQDRDGPPSKIGLKMNQLILCYTRESSRDDSESIDLDQQMWDLSEKVDRLSENSQKIWDAAAAAVLRMRGEEDGVEKEQSCMYGNDVGDRSDDDGDDDDDDGEEEEVVCEEIDQRDNDNNDENQQIRIHLLTVPETRDVGIDAMSGSQNSLFNSMEALNLSDSKEQEQSHQSLSSVSMSRSLSPSSSSSSLSLSMSYNHHNHTDHDDVCQHQHPSSSTSALNNVYTKEQEKELSESFQSSTNTVGNDRSLDHSRHQQASEIINPSNVEQIERSSNSEYLQHQTDQEQHQVVNSEILNTSAKNYMNIDKITTYSDFVADLEMNAICENGQQSCHLQDTQLQQMHHQNPHHHHRRHPIPSSPIRSIKTNGSLTPTSLERRSNCQTCPPVVMTTKTFGDTKRPSSQPCSGDSSPSPSSDHHLHHQHQQFQHHHLHQRPHSSLPFYHSYSTPSASLSSPSQQPRHHSSHASFNNRNNNHHHHHHHINRPHAPYVNQTIPRLPQSRISPLLNTTPTHRPQSYPSPVHQHQIQRPHHHHGQPYPSDPQSSKKLPPNPNIACFFPPPPPAPPQSVNNNITNTKTPSSEDGNSSPPPPPLPPRIPNPQVSRTQDGRPQVMIRPHRIQKQHSSPSSPLSFSSQPNNQRPHSFDQYLITQQRDKANQCVGGENGAHQTGGPHDQISQRPRCSSVDSSKKIKKDNKIDSNNSKSSIKNVDDDKSSGSKIPRRKLKTRRELVAMRKKSADCATECGGVGSSSRKSADGATSRSWRDIDVNKGTPLTDSSGGDNSSS